MMTVEEKDPLAELEALLATFAKQVQETLSTGACVLETARAAVKRAKDSKTRVVSAPSEVKAAGLDEAIEVDLVIREDFGWYRVE